MGAIVEICTTRKRLYDEIYKRKHIKKLSENRTDNTVECRLLYEIIMEAKENE